MPEDLTNWRKASDAYYQVMIDFVVECLLNWGRPPTPAELRRFLNEH